MFYRISITLTILWLLLSQTLSFADINTINGIDLSTISNINGTSLSGVSSINGVSIVSAPPAGCSTPDNGDEIDEGFLGAGFENIGAWTNVGSTPDSNFTLSGTPPANSCLEGLNTVATAAEVRIFWNRGSTIPVSTSTDIVMEFYVDAMTIDSFFNAFILSWAGNNDGSYGYTGNINIINSGGTYQLRAQGATLSTGIAIAENTWYTVKLHLDTAAASSYIQVDGGTQYAFTRTETAGQYLHVGAVSNLSVGESLDLEVGYIYVSTP